MTPLRGSSRVDRSSGHASTSAPSRTALIAHDHGTRIIGAVNMEKPVLIATGGLLFEYYTGARKAH